MPLGRARTARAGTDVTVVATGMQVQSSLKVAGEMAGDQSCVAEMTAAYRERHDFVVAALNDIPGFECRAGDGTFYAFPRVAAAVDAGDFESDIGLVEFLLNEADVACVPGSAFGAPGYLRVSFACSMQELEEATRRMKRAVPA